MPQIFDVTANENARYKRNELELLILAIAEFKFSHRWIILAIAKFDFSDDWIILAIAEFVFSYG